jgi:NAD(P)-dependent dehydrogenase (short-subunit alcohol dehydrogenase family)
MNHPTLIVTGSSRGLGAAVARLASSLGASVVLTARSSDLLRKEAEQIQLAGGQSLAVPGDVSREQDCRAIIQQTLERFRRIDGLVNNAGLVEPIGPIAEAQAGEWQENWAVNVLGPVLLAKMALPHLRRAGGRIVNITSGAAVTPIAGWGAYASSKAAINHLTRILAAEEPDVTTLALRPGIVDTQMQAEIREKGKDRMAESNYNRLFSLFEQGRLLPPEVPGRAIACLALFAPHEWSGEILQWDEPPVQELVARHFPPEQPEDSPD